MALISDTYLISLDYILLLVFTHYHVERATHCERLLEYVVGGILVESRCFHLHF